MFSAKRILITLVVACSVVGCSSIGNAPAGGSADEVKAAFDKMPLEEQVKVTEGSSMPADKKKEKIEELYKKAGKTPPDSGAAGSTNAPGGPPPGMGMPNQGRQ